jgi:protein-disulfide isomerase
MTALIDFVRPSRRETLGLLGAGAAILGLSPKLVFAEGEETVLTEALVLRDPDIPVAGNADGDITVVEYFDYQCPYCKKTVPELAQLAKEDGNIRLVLKDWPIFGDASVTAAKLVLASQYQHKYAEAHAILIGATSKLTETSIHDLLAQAGVDVAMATADLETHKQSIEDLLARNRAQAEAFGFEGTPGFIVGTFRIPGALEMKVFKQIVADARAAAKKHRT